MDKTSTAENTALNSSMCRHYTVQCVITVSPPKYGQNYVWVLSLPNCLTNYWAMQVTLLALLLSVSLALGCQQAVVLVRHGEDAEKGMGNLPLPDVMFPGSICGGPRMPRYDMVEEGTERATLLRDHLDGWMTELGCAPSTEYPQWTRSS